MYIVHPEDNMKVNLTQHEPFIEKTSPALYKESVRTAL